MASNNLTKARNQNLCDWKYVQNGPLLLSRKDITALVLLMLIGLILRGYFLNQVMRYDESFAFMNYVNRDFISMFSYTLPNNHVLHTLLVKIATELFGIHPMVQRLPAFLAGLLCIPATFIFCRLIIGGNSGLLSTSAVTVSPYLVLFSTNARGYSLVVLASLILAIASYSYYRRMDLKKSIIISVIAALGLLVIPTMLFAIAGIYLWIFILILLEKGFSSAVKEFLIPVGIITIIFTGLFYVPCILASGGIDPIVNNRFVKASAWNVFIANTPNHIISTWAIFTKGISNLLTILLIIMVLAGMALSFNKRNVPLLLLVPCMIFGAIGLLLVKHRIPYVRTWIYFIPFILVLADAGLSYFANNKTIVFKRIILLTIFTLSILFPINLISNNSIAEYQDTGIFRSAPIIAKQLKPRWNPGDKLYAKIPADWPVKFYLYYYIYTEGLNKRSHRIRKEYIVEDKEHYKVTDISNLPVHKIFDTGDAALYVIQ